MERGDIASYASPERACLFEGLLADPPNRVRRMFGMLRDTEDGLKGWVANELPLKSLIDSTNRLNIHTHVFTLMGGPMEEPIYQWLLRKGVSCTVHGYSSIDDALEDFRYNRGLHTIYVPTTELAYRIGIRAKVVSPTAAWGT